MKLWLLKYEEASYCDTEGFVIRAESKEEARRIAIGDAGRASLGGGGWGLEFHSPPVFGSPSIEYPDGRHDPSKITCVEVLVDGEPGVILRADVGS